MIQKAFNNNPGSRTLSNMLSDDIEVLVDLKSKMSLFKSGLSKNKEKRHILTGILSSLTGLASKKTTNQILNMVNSIDLNVQRNHLVSDILEKNQQTIINAINQSLSTINNMRSTLSNSIKNSRTNSFALITVNKFRKLAEQTIRHYESILRLSQNHMELFNLVTADKLSEIQLAFSNHAEISNNIPPKTSLVALIKESYVEIIITPDNQILITYSIPLVERSSYHIQTFHDNRIILQTYEDSEIFTTIGTEDIKKSHGDTIILTKRPLLHIKQHRDWESNLKQASQSILIEDVLLISNASLGPISIICNNGTHTHDHQSPHRLALVLPHDCSLTSSTLKIKASSFKASLNIQQNMNIKKASFHSEDSYNVPDVHSDLKLMNLTKTPTHSFNTRLTTANGISTREWAIVLALSSLLSASPWIMLFLYGFSKKSNGKINNSAAPIAS